MSVTPELALKLAADGFILVIALIGWWLENRRRDQEPLVRHRGARILIVLIIIGAIVDGALTLHTHAEEQHEQERIARIDRGVKELVELAREHDPSLTEQDALGEISREIRTLREKTSMLEHELEGVKQYSNVAKLNGFGLTGRAGLGLKETSPLSRILEGAYTREEDGGQVKFLPRCDSKGVAAFQKAAEMNPIFPFSYWALAICAAETGDEKWRIHAERAVTILKHTTQIAGHHTHHDNALEGLKKRLGQ